MANIIGNSGSSDQYVGMSTAQWARLVAIPTGWTSLRLGVRWRMQDNGSGLTLFPRLAMGLCSGTTNILGDATTTHFAGIISNSSDWAYWTGSAAVYYGFSYSPYKKVVSTATTGALYSSDCRIPYNLSPTNRFIYLHYLEITKGSPNYSFRVFTMIGNNPPTDYTEAQFYSLLTQPGADTLSLSNYAYTTTNTLAVDEATDGTFNAVNFYWDRGVVVEIHDWGIAQLA